MPEFAVEGRRRLASKIFDVACSAGQAFVSPSNAVSIGLGPQAVKVFARLGLADDAVPVTEVQLGGDARAALALRIALDDNSSAPGQNTSASVGAPYRSEDADGHAAGLGW
jgi:hypothetical protein